VPSSDPSFGVDWNLPRSEVFTREDVDVTVTILEEKVEFKSLGDGSELFAESLDVDEPSSREPLVNNLDSLVDVSQCRSLLRSKLSDSFVSEFPSFGELFPDQQGASQSSWRASWTSNDATSANVGALDTGDHQLTSPGTNTDFDGFTQGVEPPIFFSLFHVDRPLQGNFLVEEIVSRGQSDSVSLIDIHHVGFGWGEDSEWRVVVVGSSNDVNLSPSSESKRGDLDGLVPGWVIWFGQEFKSDMREKSGVMSWLSRREGRAD